MNKLNKPLLRYVYFSTPCVRCGKKVLTKYREYEDSYAMVTFPLCWSCRATERDDGVTDKKEKIK